MASSSGDGPKATADRVTIAVALLSSIASAILAALNIIFYLADRNDRINQGVFEAQATIAKNYFDSFSKLPKGEFCDHQSDALLFGRTALTLANLDEAQVANDINATSSNNVTATRNRTGTEAVAVLIYRDLIQRSRSQCDVKAVTVQPSALLGKIVDAKQTATGAASTYSIRDNTTTATSNIPTIWIHYASGSPDAGNAMRMQAALLSEGFNVPRVEGVENVPDHDQVRVYQRKDAAAAARIAKTAGIPDAEIVNLESAYKGLPGNTFEIWLKKPTSSGGTLDFSKPENSGLIDAL